MDTAGIIRKLVRHWLPKSIAKAVQMNMDRLEKTSVFLGYIRDIGKATSRFQSIISMRLPVLKSRLQEDGFCILQSDQYLYPDKTPHAHAGESILLYEQVNPVIDKSIADIVGAHHGKPMDSPGLFDDNLVLTYAQNFFGDNKQETIWIDAWEQLITQALSEACLSTVEEIGRISLQGQVLLSGLLIIADWIASNTEYFPLIGIDELIRPEIYPERVDQAWKKLRFSDVWTPGIQYMSSQTFSEIFGFAPNDVQKQVTELMHPICSITAKLQGGNHVSREYRL